MVELLVVCLGLIFMGVPFILLGFIDSADHRETRFDDPEHWGAD